MEQYVLDLDDEEEVPEDDQEDVSTQVFDDEYDSFEDMHFSKAQGG